MRRSVYTEDDARVGLPVATRVNGTAVGAAIDTFGFRTAMVVVLTGTMADGSHAIALEDSDDNATWAPVPARAIVGALPTLVATDDNVVYEVGATQIRRWLRVSATTTGATTGGVFGAAVVLGTPRRTPVSH